MSETWLYLLPAGVAAADAQWPVWLRAGDGSVRKTRLDALGATLAGPVILVLPMEMLGSCEIGPVPGKRPKPEALAYAAEEQLAAALESVHLVFAAADMQGHRRALVVERQVLRNVLTLLQTLGIDPVAIHVDADLLGGEQPSALWLDGRWLVGGRGGPWLVATPQAAEIVARQLPPMAWQAAAADGGQPLVNHRVDNAFQTLLQGRAKALDLRQGPFRRQRLALPWSALAGAVLLGFAMLCVADHWRVEGLLQRVAQQHAENVQAFQRWAPGQPVTGDLAVRVRALQAGPRTTTRMEGLAAVAQPLVETGNITLERAAFSPAQGWRMDVLALGFDDLERLRLLAPAVLMDQARQTAQGVRATLTWSGTR